MNLIAAPSELKPPGARVCLAIGVFDGVHLGHQQVIRQTISDARQHEALSVIVTFDRHPNTIVAPARAPALIYPLEKKLQVIESMGAHTVLLLPFDQALSQVTAPQFIENLKNGFGPIQSICVGSTFTFGHRRGGNVELLQSLGRDWNFTVHGLAAIALDGDRVSSTRIREAIRSADFDAASQMLGRAYSLCGRVVEGDRVGRTLGFPTANLAVEGIALPPTGVYAAHVEVGGKNFRAVLNIGHRPTLRSPAPELRVEAHLLDFSSDLYGAEMELTFVAKLREEQKFASLQDLKSQIARDIISAATIFKSR